MYTGIVIDTNATSRESNDDKTTPKDDSQVEGYEPDALGTQHVAPLFSSTVESPSELWHLRLTLCYCVTISSHHFSQCDEGQLYRAF